MSDVVIREVRPGTSHRARCCVLTRVSLGCEGCLDLLSVRRVSASHALSLIDKIRPFARFGMIPVGGRSTAIRMTDGGVWVMASTPLTPETKAKLSEIGPVK
jgi:hypothetical protein